MSNPNSSQPQSFFILSTTFNRTGSAQDRIRRGHLKALAEYTGRDTIIYASAFASEKGPEIPGPVMAVAIQDVQGFVSALQGLKGDKLDLVLHSPGGSMRAADQIVRHLRGRYHYIRAIIPQNAMSAATMIACACDEIVMAKDSALGPIDPQVTFPTRSGSFTTPAHTILDEFERAQEEAAESRAMAPSRTSRIEAYPDGLLDYCRAILDASRDKVAQWLDSYMFRDIERGERPGRRIADWLGNARAHETHEHPISIERARSAGLRIGALEQDQGLQERVLSSFHATMVTFGTTSAVKVVENQNGEGLFFCAEARAIPQRM